MRGRTCDGINPRGKQGPGCRPREATRGENGDRNGSRRMQAAWGAETSGVIWPVAGAGNFQVDGALRWERRWGASVT